MRICALVVLVALLMSAAAGCSKGGTENAAAPPAQAAQSTEMPQEAATPAALSEEEYEALKAGVTMPVQTLMDAVRSEEGYTIDFSNSSKGYITVSCDSVPEKKMKVQISKDDEKYFYDFKGTSPFETYPLQMGDGEYTVIIFENIEDDKYAQVMAAERDVQLESEFAPYLLPSKIVDYTPESDAVYTSFALTQAAQSDLERTEEVYGYIVDHIQYDQQKADTVETGYLPDVDETLATNKGICYDYSALLACMLRAKGIPVRLVMGYVEGLDVYHAWNEIFIRDVGWVRSAVYFDGENWQIADSTFGAANAVSAEDSDKYTPVKWY